MPGGLLGLVMVFVGAMGAALVLGAFGMWVVTGLTLTGLCGMNLFWPWAGFLPALVTYSALYFNGFFVSYYINREASSEQRATVLSFKGLAYNLSYGLIGIVYAGLLEVSKSGIDGNTQVLENIVFQRKAQVGAKAQVFKLPGISFLAHGCGQNQFNMA